MSAPSQPIATERAVDLRGVTAPMIAFVWSTFFAGASAVAAFDRMMGGKPALTLAACAIVDAVCAYANSRILRRHVLSLVKAAVLVGVRLGRNVEADIGETLSTTIEHVAERRAAS